MVTTKTIGPLHLEDLEPHRFEDLVRQLIYDLKDWRKLEATGRSGADDGYDARGEERQWTVDGAAEAEVSDDDTSVDHVPPDGSGRIWLIQCKREKAIGPTKLLKYLRATDLTGLYGVIFAGACDFSKTTRDRFSDAARDAGLSEAHLWGKAEIEDMLFQPKNDHLLFAYFGVSLAIRKRSAQARLRAQTTIKRKLKRAFDGRPMVLLRDTEDTRYPFREIGHPFDWWVFPYSGLTWRGLECMPRRHYAYIQRDGDTWKWDYANTLNVNSVSEQDDPWRSESMDGGQQELWKFWSELPRDQQAWLTVKGVIGVGDIVEIDDVGDDITRCVHVYIRASRGEDTPFSSTHPELTFVNNWQGGSVEPIPENRVRKFPARFRKPLPFQESDPSADRLPPNDEPSGLAIDD